MDQNDIAIIGYGVVGRGMDRVFPGARIVDPFVVADNPPFPERYDQPGQRAYRVAFVCVPTPMLEDGSCDTTIVEQAIHENNAEVFVIKSTVPPGTTRRIIDGGFHAVMSPEFYGTTPSSKDVDQHFVILGGNPGDVSVAAEVYKAVKPGTFRVLKTDPTTAELVKYAENSWIATKVVFFNDFYRICGHFGVDNDEFRELLLHDRRISPFHTWVFPDKPYAKSHCITKDVSAIIAACCAAGYDAPFLSAMWDVNNRWINEHKEDQV